MPTDDADKARAWRDENLHPSWHDIETDHPAAYDIQQSRAKREHHEANLAELRERQARGELVEAARVQLAATTLAAMTRSAFERIPDKLAERLAAETDAHVCHAMMIAEIDLVLADLAAGARRLSVKDDDRAAPAVCP